MPEAKKNMDPRELLSCVATPLDVGSATKMRVKSGSKTWFSGLGRNFLDPHRES